MKDVIVNGMHQQRQAQSFTRDELIAQINSFLNSQGETEVKEEKFGDKYISITSDSHLKEQ